MPNMTIFQWGVVFNKIILKMKDIEKCINKMNIEETI